jgi:hypothetical protein
MDVPVPLGSAPPLTSLQLREIRAAAFASAEQPPASGGVASAGWSAAAAAESAEAACAAAWDAAFAGPIESSSPSLLAACAQLRERAADVCDAMLAGIGGGGYDGAEGAIDALKGAVEALAAQLAVQRRQEALARVCLQAEGLEPGGVASARASLERLRNATAALAGP